MNVQSHFAKYLGSPIWNEDSKAVVKLVGLRKDYLVYQNGKPEEEHGMYPDFNLIVKNKEDVLKNNLPENLAVIVVGGIATKVTAITPETFLKRLKSIIYAPLNLTDKIMLANHRSRKRELVEARQLIMAAYFCAWERHPRFNTITLAEAGRVFLLDHATVLHAIKTVNNLIDTDKAYKEYYSPVWQKVMSVNPFSRLHIR